MTGAHTTQDGYSFATGGRPTRRLGLEAIRVFGGFKIGWVVLTKSEDGWEDTITWAPDHTVYPTEADAERAIDLMDHEASQQGRAA